MSLWVHITFSRISKIHFYWKSKSCPKFLPYSKIKTKALNVIDLWTYFMLGIYSMQKRFQHIKTWHNRTIPKLSSYPRMYINMSSYLTQRYLKIKLNINQASQIDCKHCWINTPSYRGRLYHDTLVGLSTPASMKSLF